MEKLTVTVGQRVKAMVVRKDKVTLVGKERSTEEGRRNNMTTKHERHGKGKLSLKIQNVLQFTEH